MTPSFLSRQHRSIQRQLLELRSDHPHERALRAHLVEDLAIHIAAELDVLYPAIRVAAGFRAPDILVLERARDLLSVVADGPSAGVAYRTTLEELATVFARHVEMQEGTVFPVCAERLDPATFRQIIEDAAVVSFRLASHARARAGRTIEPTAPR